MRHMTIGFLAKINVFYKIFATFDDGRKCLARVMKVASNVFVLENTFVTEIIFKNVSLYSADKRVFVWMF